MFRLNDFLNPENVFQALAERRSLKNSLKRNTILPSLQPVKLNASSQYESKLTGYNFKQKDLLMLFQHIYKKEQMSISDRNFIKQNLLTIFPEGLISSAGKKLIQYTEFVCIKKGNHNFGNGMLNLIMKGNVTITSQFYSKKASQGEYFGHLELLTDMENNSYQFIAESDTFMISINQEGFYAGIEDYFLKLYMYKTRVIPKIIADKLQPIQGFLLCEEMKRKSYGIGQKISKKGQKITQIMFLEQGKLSQNVDLESSHLSTLILTLEAKIQFTVGLSQLLNNITFHLSNNFTLEQTKGYIISVQELDKIVSRQMLNVIKQELTIISIQQSCLPGQLARSKTEVSESSMERFKSLEMESDNIKNFIRIRRVNLPYFKPKFSLSNKQSPKISKTSNYQASFVFIKDQKGLQKNKKGRLDRANKIMSLQTSPFKPYLQNIEVPSLVMYKEYSVL